MTTNSGYSNCINAAPPITNSNNYVNSNSNNINYNNNNSYLPNTNALGGTYDINQNNIGNTGMTSPPGSDNSPLTILSTSSSNINRSNPFSKNLTPRGGFNDLSNNRERSLSRNKTQHTVLGSSSHPIAPPSYTNYSNQINNNLLIQQNKISPLNQKSSNPYFDSTPGINNFQAGLPNTSSSNGIF